MTGKAEKYLPVVFAIVAMIVYIVKYHVGLPLLYFPLLVMVALTITASACLAAAAQPSRTRRIFVAVATAAGSRAYAAALAAIVALFFMVFTAMAIAKFNAFSLRMFDFGFMDQAIWNTAHGRLLEVTDVVRPYSNVSRLSTHVEIIYFAFAALYRVASDPRMLFAGQTLFVCAAIVLIFVIARIVLNSNGKALAIAGTAALFPALQFMVLFDFHGDVLAIPFFLLSYLGYLKKSRLCFWLGLVFALFCKEYAGLAAAGYGCALIAAHRDWKRGFAVVLLGVLYFLAAFYVIVPFFNSGHESTLASLDYGAIGGKGGLSGMTHFVITQPLAVVKKMGTMQNAESFFYLFFPLAFLPVLSPAFLLGAVPIFFKDMLFGMDIGTHHLACGVPFVFISFIYGIRRCEEIMSYPRCKKMFGIFGYPLLLVCVMSAMASFFYGPSPLGHQFWRGKSAYAISGHTRACEAVIKNIPASAPISVSDNLAPHLTHRRYCWVFPAPLTLSPPILTRAEYVCIDTSFRLSMVWGHTNFADQTLPLLRSVGFDSIMERDGVFLFKKRSAK